MIKVHMDKFSAVPWWAAFGAPLVGVPLLVVLLALGAPRKAQSNEADTSGSHARTEQVASPVQNAIQLPPPYKEDVPLPRC